MQRSRFKIGAALVLVILLGLGTRVSAIPWPDFVSANFGDALWTTAVYLSLCFLFPTARPLNLGIAAVAISFGVEISQLIDWHWLNTIRKTLPGKLLLGTGFQWADFPRYAAGGVIPALIELYRPTLLNKKGK